MSASIAALLKVWRSLQSSKTCFRTVNVRLFARVLGILVSILLFGSLLARIVKVAEENRTMLDLQRTNKSDFPGCDYHSTDRKNWMSLLNPERIRVNQIVWPGTHDSATNEMLLLFRPFAGCQTLSIYEQLKIGTRVLDIRVNEDRMICHGPAINYSIDRVLGDVKQFLRETLSEIIILEIRTEYGYDDPPEFAKYLIDQLGEYLILPDDQVFNKTVSELLPKRIICVWKPINSTETNPSEFLWNPNYLRDNWTDTGLPYTKFISNMKLLEDQQHVLERNYFYRVENTVTPQWFYPFISATNRIKPYARLFISQCFSKGIADKLQIFSTDFISEDFVDVCIGLTKARAKGRA